MITHTYRAVPVVSSEQVETRSQVNPTRTRMVRGNAEVVPTFSLLTTPPTPLANPARVACTTKATGLERPPHHCHAHASSEAGRPKVWAPSPTRLRARHGAAKGKCNAFGVQGANWHLALMWVKVGIPSNSGVRCVHLPRA